MQKIQSTVQINAPREKVWESLWGNPFNYNTWTSPFMEGSTVETDNWKEGSRVIFGDGSGSGMLAEIAANRPNEFMSFRHIGMIKDGVEDTTSEAVSSWSGAMENYTLSGENGNSTLQVELDVNDDFKDYMEKTWPLAMEKIKGLSEGTVKPVITVSAVVNAPVDIVWDAWTKPEHVTRWNHASDDWHCPAAAYDLRTGGRFSATMAAKDGSFSFDFAGDFTEVKEQEFIEAVLGDGRRWKTSFKPGGNQTSVTERFEAENMHSLDMQHAGWQAILNNFKKYTETLKP